MMPEYEQKTSDVSPFGYTVIFAGAIIALGGSLVLAGLSAYNNYTPIWHLLIGPTLCGFSVFNTWRLLK